MRRILAGLGTAALVALAAAPAHALTTASGTTAAPGAPPAAVTPGDVVPGTWDGVVDPARVGCDEGHWPSTVEGEPASFDPGDAAGYRVWHDGSGWHLRTTTPSDGSHIFTGVIRSADDVRIVAEYRNEADDVVRVHGRTIEFRFDTHDHVDGLDFVVGCTDHVSFALAARAHDGAGPRPVPADRIWLGLHGRAPGNPFTVFRVA